MTRLGRMVVLGILGIVAVVAILFMWLHARSPQYIPPTTHATTTPAVNPSTLSIYTSGEYGFAFFYPSAAHVTDAYSSTTPALVAWRLGAVGTGTPIVSIKHTGQEVRVGVSTDQKDIRICTKAGSAETAQGSLVVGSTTWQKFSFQKIGTNNEQQVTSYRTLHKKACFALELFQPLTKTASSTGYTLGDIITSFSFAD